MVELVRVEARLFQNIQHELFVRVAKEPADQVPHFEASGILPIHEREIDVGTLVFHVLHVSLFFQDANDRQDGVVSQGRLGGKRLQHLVNRGGAAVPEHIHNAQLGFGQGCGFAASQRFLRVVLRPIKFDVAERKTSTNLLVARRCVRDARGYGREIGIGNSREGALV